MMQATLPELLNHLSKNGYIVDLEHDSREIFTILKLANLDFPIYLRIFTESSLIQLITYIPSQLSKITLNETARLLHILNKEVDMPGFGLDENALLIFYRQVLPLHQRQIDEDLFLSYLNTSEQITQLFNSAIQAVASGKATPEVALKEILQQSN